MNTTSTGYITATAAATITGGRRTIREGATVKARPNSNGTVSILMGSYIVPVPAIWVRF